MAGQTGCARWQSRRSCSRCSPHSGGSLVRATPLESRESARFKARGFYDLAIAAPSKAALEAWGADSNPPIRASRKRATPQRRCRDDVQAGRGVLAASGVESAFRGALRSAVGARNPARTGLGRKSVAPKPAKRCAPEISELDARKPAADFEKEQQRRDAERRREEAARQRGRERHDKADSQSASRSGQGRARAREEGRGHPGRGRGSREAFARRGRPVGQGKGGAACRAVACPGLSNRATKECDWLSLSCLTKSRTRAALHRGIRSHCSPPGSLTWNLLPAS